MENVYLNNIIIQYCMIMADVIAMLWADVIALFIGLLEIFGRCYAKI